MKKTSHYGEAFTPKDECFVEHVGFTLDGEGRKVTFSPPLHLKPGIKYGLVIQGDGTADIGEVDGNVITLRSGEKFEVSFP